MRSLLLVLWIFWPSVALADPAAQSLFHDRLARKQYEDGKYEQALREFFLSNRLAPNARTQFNIALCFLRLKRSNEAFVFFTEYLTASDVSTERRAFAEKTLAELKATVARTMIESDPPGATIYVDKKEHGSYGRTPKLLAIDPGHHEIKLELDGFRDRSAPLEAVRGRQVKIAVQLVARVGRLLVAGPKEGTLLVRDVAGSALEGAAVGKSFALRPGRYEVELRLAGRVPFIRSVEVRADEVSRIDVAAQELVASVGAVTVTSNRAGALVKVDGSPVGFTPLVLASVEAGEHRLAVESEGWQPWSGAVSVESDERLWVTVEMESHATSETSPATWIVGGGGLAFALAGGVTGALALVTRRDYDTEPSPQLLDRGRSLNLATDVLLATGGAALLTSLFLYLFTDGGDAEASSATFARGTR